MQNRKQSRVQDFFSGDFAVKAIYDPAFQIKFKAR
jgi:hypothetical protein